MEQTFKLIEKNRTSTHLHYNISDCYWYCCRCYDNLYYSLLLFEKEHMIKKSQILKKQGDNNHV